MFEVPDEEWSHVKAHLRRLLIRVARRRGTITYGEIVREIEGFEGPHSHALAWMLGEVCNEDGRDHGMLSAVTVLASGSGQGTPGEGFWNAAVDYPNLAYSPSLRNRELQDLRLAFWVNELHRCYDEHADRRPPRTPLAATI